MSISIGVNKSPFAGKAGKLLTSRTIRERREIAPRLPRDPPEITPRLPRDRHEIARRSPRDRPEINKNPSQDPKVSFLVLPGVPGSSQGPPGCQSGGRVSQKLSKWGPEIES